MKDNSIAINEKEYTEILRKAVEEIHNARNTLARQVNSNTVSVYWNLGKLLSEKQVQEGYGSGVVHQLSVDLKEEFPTMGLSPRNLWDMKRSYELYFNSTPKLRQAVAVLPWGHNLLLINKINNDTQAEFYANESLTKGWSRDMLLNAIKMDIFGQVNKQLKTNNFENTLSKLDAHYANEVFKSTYNLAFLGITEPVRELELEK